MQTWKCWGRIVQRVHIDCSCARLQPCLFCLISSHLYAFSLVKSTAEAAVLPGFDSSFPVVSSQHSPFLFFILLSLLRGSSFFLFSFSRSSFPAQPVGNHCLSHGCDFCRLPGPWGLRDLSSPYCSGHCCHPQQQLLLQAPCQPAAFMPAAPSSLLCPQSPILFPPAILCSLNVPSEDPFDILASHFQVSTSALLQPSVSPRSKCPLPLCATLSQSALLSLHPAYSLLPLCPPCPYSLPCV